jgi:hypothetical protein
LNGPGDLPDTDPLLGPLQDNGGPTPTMALLPGSPAIDAGDNADAPDWDQRGEGFARVVGILDPDNPVIDIGAYEVQQNALLAGHNKAAKLVALLTTPNVPPTSALVNAVLPHEAVHGNVATDTVPPVQMAVRHSTNVAFTLVHRVVRMEELVDGWDVPAPW